MKSQYDSQSAFAPHANEGGVRYRYTFPGGQHLDSLLVVKQSKVLVVSLHGAIDRKKYTLPRFERFRTLRQYSCSSLYIGDATLWASDELELAWFTGWEGVDLFPILSEMITRAADAAKCEHIIVNGGSGGGFAALQVSALIPGSTAVVYNPQTSIWKYLHPQWPLMPQKRYLRYVWPEFYGHENNFDFSRDWTEVFGDRLSAVRRYTTPQRNSIVYLINQLDNHHVEDHLNPFAAAVGNRTPLRIVEYEGEPGHSPTSAQQFGQGLYAAAEWKGFDLTCSAKGSS